MAVTVDHGQASAIVLPHQLGRGDERVVIDVKRVGCNVDLQVTTDGPLAVTLGRAA